VRKYKCREMSSVLICRVVQNETQSCVAAEQLMLCVLGIFIGFFSCASCKLS